MACVVEVKILVEIKERIQSRGKYEKIMITKILESVSECTNNLSWLEESSE